MAAKKDALSLETEVEGIVNRWAVDYYMSRALDAFEKEQHDEFDGFKYVIDSILVRSVESTDFIPTKIKVFQFLSWINEGETPDVSSDSATPLELALKFLPSMTQECNIPEGELEKACSSIRDMIVVIFIKNSKFAKAKETLVKHFPKSMTGKKAIFMGLVNRKSNTHDIIQHADFHQFRKDMLAFCRRLCLFSVPFLHKAAKQLIDIREQDESASMPDEQEERGPLSAQVDSILFVSCKHKIIKRERLEAAFKMLAPKSAQVTLVELQEQMEIEEQGKVDNQVLTPSPCTMEGGGQDSEPEGDFQRNSESPLEAAVADNPPQTDAVPLAQSGSLTKSSSPPPRTRRFCTVARLVVEPDSQTSSAQQESDADIQQSVSPQTNKTTSSSPMTDEEVIQPSRKMRKRAYPRSRDSVSLTLSTDSEEDVPGPRDNKVVCGVEIHNRSQQSLGRNSTTGGDHSSDADEELTGEGHQPESPVHQRTADKSHEESRVSATSDQDKEEDYEIESSHSSGSASPHPPVPQSSSTPQRSDRINRTPHKKWNQIFQNAKESKDAWSDEESFFPSKKSKSHNSNMSPSGGRKKMWSDSETEMLKKGVKKFGEGNWNKIKAYYSFEGRSNVNLKDRWRTLKKLGLLN